MLPSVFRLKKKKEFERVFNCSRATSGEFFILRQTPNSLSFSRFGFIVSAKVSPKATERNRLKRQAGEIIRENLKRIKKGTDVVLIFKNSARAKEYSKLKNDLFSLLLKNKLYLKLE
jgi:ribonuclease P protein component